ncbi:Ser-Thr-rich glycosyl-phosphatidyl-inositol-anchored membrane family-domain-containing protein [Tuber indicum]|nr:Ser-Thr-rich glycosyl-phosphatidyl-inositol-anchored membrane family-domain-containing protein [Tuber indicum]
MKYTLFTALAAAFTFANAYTTPVGDTPEGNPIGKPGLGEIVPAGSPYTITWNPTTGGTVTLLLLRGPSNNVVPLYPIVEKAPNTGTYTWTPATDLEADVSRYGIQLIDDATGKYQYTTQFGVSNSNPYMGSSSSSAPPLYPLSVPSTSSVSTSCTSSLVPTHSVSTSCTSSLVPTHSVPTYAVSSGYPTAIGGLVTSGTVLYSTSMVTVTSCGPTVTNCPGKPYTTPATVWTSPAWNGTATKLANPTGYPSAIPSTNVTKPSIPVIPVSPGAGDKVRVGGVMLVVMVAGLALLL